MPEYINDPDLLAQLEGGVKTRTPQDFARVYGPAAERAGRALGVEPSMLLGQWGLETGWGKSVVPGTNNLGNIKDFAGGGVAATDNMTGSKDKYRAYDSPEAFADDFTSLIQRKYPGAVGAKDPMAFAKALKDGGYAEDPRYVDKVVQASRMAGATQNPVMQAVGRAVEAVIPSAEAAPQGRQYIQDPEILAQLEAADAKPGKREKTGLENVVNAAARLNPLSGIVDAATGGDMSIGVARGFKDVIDTGADYLARGYDKVTGASRPNLSSLVTGQPQGEAARVQAMNEAGKQDFKQTYGDSTAAGLGRVAGNVAITMPVGGALSAPLKAAAPYVAKAAPAAANVLTRLAGAVSSSGSNVGGVQGGNALANLAIRSAGGAATGGASAALIDPESAGLGAAVGGALPPAIAAVGAAGRAAGSLVRPFYAAGQNQIAGDALRQAATNPAAARNALAAAQEIVPGSAPTAATAAGDDGLAALSRAMQNASPEYASSLSARQTAQNQARTAAIEDIAGNTGKIALAKDARKALTDPMREEVLNAAGKVPSDGILKSIDRLIAKPDNAGELSQQALNKFRSRIEQFSQDGAIDARALYEIRKDINTTLQGKLQGDAGNLKYASSQLGNVKGLIDDAIDQASRRVASPAPLSASREVVPFQASTELGAPGGRAVGPAGPVPAAQAAGGPRPTWKGYLQSYASESIPIGQMEKLDDILKSVQTGTVDSQGGAILSAAKLNNVLKNQGADLVKDLSPAQLDVLRRIQADLNAGQIANNTGRAIGSNTVQNLAQNQLLQGLLGRQLGGSSAATSTLGRLLQLPYGTANKQIQERLGNALLDPKEAARLLADPQQNMLLQALTRPAELGYKAAPALTAR